VFIVGWDFTKNTSPKIYVIYFLPYGNKKKILFEFGAVVIAW
jgi:hypothetical protein